MLRCNQDYTSWLQSVLSFLHEYVNLSIVGNVMFIIINYHFKINKNTFETCVPVLSYPYIPSLYVLHCFISLSVLWQEMFTTKFVYLRN
jgi:hypothetical protein